MRFRTRSRRPPSRNASTAVRLKPSLDFSITGLVYCSMMMFLGLAAINSQANLLFGVFGLMIGVLLVSGTISRLVLRRVEIERILPEQFIVGRPATLSYEFHNHKRFWPSFSISLGELDGCDALARQPYSYMLHAAAHATARISTEVLPVRRGLHSFDRYQISTSFPFGFIKRAVIHHRKDMLLIYPAIGEVDHRLLELCRSADKTGAVMRPRRGGLDEFYGVKEYRQGDNPRWIHWKRSARTGVLVTREMTQVAPPKLLILVDTHLTDHTPATQAALERSIAQAASLAHHALETGMSVGLYTWSGDWVSIPPNRGKRHTRDLLTALARLPVNTTHTLHELMAASHEMQKSGTTPVLFTPHDLGIGRSDARAALLVIPALSLQAARWFRFSDKIDFAHAMPSEQEPQ